MVSGVPRILKQGHIDHSVQRAKLSEFFAHSCILFGHTNPPRKIISTVLRKFQVWVPVRVTWWPGQPRAWLYQWSIMGRGCHHLKVYTSTALHQPKKQQWFSHRLVRISGRGSWVFGFDRDQLRKNLKQKRSSALFLPDKQKTSHHLYFSSHVLTSKQDHHLLNRFILQPRQLDPQNRTPK